uniref:Uncharacterized protein n=1 Tax=Arion vulgaris TaxID=1028688 RepID=A0A0B6ZS94_9EUPU
MCRMEKCGLKWDTMVRKAAGMEQHRSLVNVLMCQLSREYDLLLLTVKYAYQ